MVLKKKSLGQNFLNDQNICKKIIKNLDIKNKSIIEIGPGYGFLTDSILEEKPKDMILIEKDREFCEYLKDKYKNNKVIKILNINFLNYNFNNNKKIKVIGNLPYNIASKIILKLFKNSKFVDDIIVMIQKEVAIKFDYKLNKFNKYKFINKLVADYKICFDVSPNVFKPKPKVISSVVKFKLKNTIVNWEKLNAFIEKIFKNKRKKISNNISIKNIKNINLNRRIEELNFEEILYLYNLT